MPLEQFRHKAEYLQVKARWTVIANYLTYCAVLAFLGFQYTRAPNPISRAGLVLLAAGSLYVVWRAHKQQWPLSPAPNISAATWLEAYRRELQRSRDHSRNVWIMVTPLIPGSIVFALPSSVLFAIWLVFLLPVRRRKLRKIEGEIATLDQLAESGSDSPGQRGN